MTPNDIEILIHCHVSADMHPRYENNIKVIDRLLADRLIVRHGNCIFRTTDKGAAHVKQLCDLQLPTIQYARFDGTLISMDHE